MKPTAMVGFLCLSYQQTIPNNVVIPSCRNHTTLFRRRALRQGKTTRQFHTYKIIPPKVLTPSSHYYSIQPYPGNPAWEARGNDDGNSKDFRRVVSEIG